MPWDVRPEGVCDVDDCPGPVHEVRVPMVRDGAVESWKSTPRESLKLCRSHAGDGWEIERTISGQVLARKVF